MNLIKRGLATLALVWAMLPLHAAPVPNGLQFTYTGPSEFVYPFDGKQQSIRFNVTNTAATPTGVYALRISVNGSTNEYPGYAHFPNGSNFSLVAGESSIVSCWVQGVYENLGPTAPPTVGESKQYTVDFVFTDASKPIATAESFIVSQKVTFTNLGDLPTLTGGLTLKAAVRFDGATTLPAGALVELATPYTPSWFAATATAAPASNGATLLSVTQPLPLRSDWLARVSAPGYASRMVALADVTTQSTATLDVTLSKAAAPTIAYKLATQMATPTGFWRGAVSESEGTFIAIPGQENWKIGATDAETRSYREASRLYKYRFDGTKVWEHTPGWEIWGGDMTPDGKYVAYALNPSQTSFYRPTEYKLVLLDGTTGSPLWSKSGSTADIAVGSEAKKLESLEVALSPDGKYLAVGSTGSGQVSVFDRETGNPVWSTSSALDANFGQVRNLKFSSDSAFLYAGSGDNFLRKFRMSDGVVLWKTMVGGWPFVNGLNFSPDGSLITTGTKSFNTAAVRTADGAVVWLRNTQYFDSVPSADGAVTTSFNGVIYRLSDGVIAGMTKTHALSAYTPDSAYLLRLSSDLSLYDLTGVKLATFDKSTLNINPGEQPQWSYATKDGRYVIALGRDMATPGSTGIAIWERTSGATTTASSTDCLFNWAEDSYPIFFKPSRPSTETVGEYTLRRYPTTSTYLGVASSNGRLYFYAPSALTNPLLDLGLASQWKDTAGCGP
jgi:WD40 repeat protein